MDIVDFKAMGRLVAKRRGDLGLSQKELAGRAKVSIKYVSLIELGKRKNISLHVLNGLSRVLRIPPTELITELIEGPSDELRLPLFLPSALVHFGSEVDLDFETMNRLARIPLQGLEPKTADQWRELYFCVRPFIEKSEKQMDLERSGGRIEDAGVDTESVERQPAYRISEDRARGQNYPKGKNAKENNRSLKRHKRGRS